MDAHLNIIGPKRENLFLILIIDVHWHNLKIIGLGVRGLIAGWFCHTILCDLLSFI